nr:patatin-like phospholipase family protein [Haloarcula taiwanensis]
MAQATAEPDAPRGRYLALRDAWRGRPRLVPVTADRHIAFDEFDNLTDEAPPHVTIGTVTVNSGVFETFTDATVTSKAVLASAAFPLLYEAVELNGHWHWYGLFSQNPPIREFLTSNRPKPDEISVIQIEPQTRDDRPASLAEITDRRQELAGNLSLNQELFFVQKVNDWIEQEYLPEAFKHVEYVDWCLIRS